jgi:methyl-accepting chemotaxis protein
MNDSDKGGMTISSLLLMGLIVSLAVPEAAILVLGVMRGSADATTFSIVALSGALAVLIVVLGVNYFVRRRVQDRLLSLVDVCRNFAGGDRAVRAPVAGDDEFAMLSMSLNSLLDNQNFTASSAPVSNASGGGEAATLQAQIEKLLQEVSAVGDGDLRVQAEVTPDTLGVLADSFNYMIEELAKVVGRVQATSVQVTNGTRRILDRSSELVKASETQVVQISQTTQAVEALAIFIQNVARNARLSAEAAQEALHNANTGQDAVKQSIEGMMLIRENVQDTAKKIKRLGERSNEIGEIVRIIEDIADQTNLLALNAAIQSAMAGEHGRGFAVVADEIRLLAERSTESTKRIATLVKSIQGDTYEAVVAMEDSTQEVVKGSQLADDAGRALNSIYTAVERQAQMIEGIARAANEQAQVSESVAIAMGQISEITQQTNIGTQEASMSVSYLAELADQLRASVSTFRLPERTNDMVEIFPDMAGVPALPGGDQFYQQDMEMSNDWNAGFSSDFLSLPQPNEASNSGSYQFAFNGQQEYAPQQNYMGAQPYTGQQGFDAQPYSGQVNANGQYFGSQPGFPPYNGGNDGSDRNSGDPGGFEMPGGFDEPVQFDFGQNASYSNNNQGYYAPPQSNSRFPQQNFGSQPGQSAFPSMPGQSGQPGQMGQPEQPGQQMGQPIGPRPRMRNSQQGQPAYSQDQMPHQNSGHLGQ